MRSSLELRHPISNLKKAWDARQPSGILCHRHKFIYFPVSKAGGSSMKTMIAEMEGLPTEGNPHSIPLTMVRADERDKYPDYRTFVIVRNPWSRLLSCYKDKVYWRRLESGEIVRRQQIFAGFGRYNRLFGLTLFHPDMSFCEFVRTVARIPDFLSDRHFRSQYKSFCGSDGKPFVDCIIRLENFQAEMQSFLSSVGAGDVDIRHKHVTRETNVEQYDDELADLVARRYRRDIELLNYSRPQ